MPRCPNNPSSSLTCKRRGPVCRRCRRVGDGRVPLPGDRRRQVDAVVAQARKAEADGQGGQAVGAAEPGGEGPGSQGPRSGRGLVAEVDQGLEALPLLRSGPEDLLDRGRVRSSAS